MNPGIVLKNVRHESALYFDRSGRGRFDGAEQGYGILYTGEDEYVTFIESYGRVHGARGVAESALLQRNLVCITSTRPLVIANITGSGLVKIGEPRENSFRFLLNSKEVGASNWSHPMQVDGIRYHLRHDDTRCCYGLFDQTSTYLVETTLGNLVESHPVLLAQLLAHYDYGLL